MKKLNLRKLGIVFFGFHTMIYLQAAAENITKQVQRDGLEFTVVYPNNFSSTGPFVVTCQLRNLTKQAIPYELMKRSVGFSLKLRNKHNQDISPNKEWAKRNIPDPTGMGMHASEEIEPGKSLLFKVNLYEAFGDRASEGSKLTVMWNPGYYGGVPLTLGQGLEISFALPTSKISSANASPTPSTDQGTSIEETK